MWLRRNVLRLLLPVCVSWAVLVLFAEALFDWIPEARRATVEPAMIVGVSLVCAILAWLVCRRWPSFLSLSPAVPAAFVLVRAVTYAPILLGVLAVFFGALEYVNLRLTGDPGNPQYGVSVVFVALWYPVALTPVLTVLAVGRAAKRRAPGAAN